MTCLLDFDDGRPVRIVEIEGGEGVRRRLFSLGFHKGDVVGLSARGVLRGPVLLRNIETGVTVAVVDTGVAYENYSVYSQAPDLAGTSFTAGYDFVNSDTHPNDDWGIGTRDRLVGKSRPWAQRTQNTSGAGS
jgi:Fe2+ transport system protein FeoA